MGRSCRDKVTKLQELTMRNWGTDKLSLEPRSLMASVTNSPSLYIWLVFLICFILCFLCEWIQRIITTRQKGIKCQLSIIFVNPNTTQRSKIFISKAKYKVIIYLMTLAVLWKKLCMLISLLINYSIDKSRLNKMHLYKLCLITPVPQFKFKFKCVEFGFFR